MLKPVAPLLFLYFAFVCPSNALHAEDFASKGAWIDEIGLSIGYTRADLRRKEDLETIPVTIIFGFDMRSWVGIDQKYLLELTVEPFAGFISSPESNVEIGIPVSVRFGYPATQRIYPFIHAGVGPYFLTQNTAAQSTQFNFINKAGGGIIYHFNNKFMGYIDIRVRHISNAGIDDPNKGINAGEMIVGISYLR